MTILFAFFAAILGVFVMVVGFLAVAGLLLGPTLPRTFGKGRRQR